MKTEIISTPALTILATPGYKKQRVCSKSEKLLGDFLITQHGMTWEAGEITREKKFELDGMPVKPYTIYHF